MTFHQINIFRCVVMTRSFKAAAEALYLSEPSVSIQLKNFEKSLGITLIDRKQTARNGSIILTEEGKAVYGSVCTILDQVDIIKGISNKTRENYKRTLNILTNSSTSTYILPNVLYKYSEHNPDVVVKLTVLADIDQLCKLSSSSSYDICIIPIEKGKEIKNIVSTFKCPMKLVAAKNKASAERKMVSFKSGEPLPFSRIMLPSRNSGARRAIEQYFERENITLRSQMEIGQAETTKRLLFESPDYCAFLSSITTKQEIDSGLLQEIKTDLSLPYVEFAVVSNKSAYKNKQNKDFVQCLNEVTRGYRE